MTKESITITTPDHGTLEFDLAGLGSRFCAHLIDTLLIGLLILLLALFALAVGGLDLRSMFQDLEGGAWTSSFGLALLILVGFVVYWGYYVFFESIMRGATLGKREFGIRVIREDGLPIGFREAALRNLVRAADALPPPCYLLGGLVMFLDANSRRLGDMVAGTLVVRVKYEVEPETEAGAAWAARVERGQSRQAVTLPGGAVTATQVDLIEQFLARRFELTAARRQALAWQITAPLLALRGEDPAAWQGRADGADRCERFLLEVVELAKSPQRAAVAPVPQGRERVLF
jgi:uncharacterized RDD family membrane protein YckC